MIVALTLLVLFVLKETPLSAIKKIKDILDLSTQRLCAFLTFFDFFKRICADIIKVRYFVNSRNERTQLLPSLQNSFVLFPNCLPVSPVLGVNIFSLKSKAP